MESQSKTIYQEMANDGIWGTELVAECFGCPACGNTEMDSLEWDSNCEQVTCTKCGVSYEPGED